MTKQHKKVLIVDDAIFIRNFIKAALKMMEITDIREAADGKEGLASVQSQTFDLIISDWHMPNMNGYELLCAVRESEHNKETPFLMLTSDVSKENVESAIDAGVNDYMAKPFRHDPLIRKVSRLLNIEPVSRIKVVR